MTTPYPQFPQYQAQIQTPPKKKGGCLKWGAIIGGAFIVLASCSVLMVGGEVATESSFTTPTVTSTAPAPLAQVPGEKSQPEAPKVSAPKVTNEQKSALKKAESYSKNMNMSKARIYHQLTSEYGEKFSPEAAQYAIDNLKADYKQNALKKAESYQKNMSMSPDRIYDQLISEYGEQFTPEEAQYAVDNLAP